MTERTIEQRLEALESSASEHAAALDALKTAPAQADGKDAVAREVLGKVLTAAGEIYTGAGDDKAKL